VSADKGGDNRRRPRCDAGVNVAAANGLEAGHADHGNLNGREGDCPQSRSYPHTLNVGRPDSRPHSLKEDREARGERMDVDVYRVLEASRVALVIADDGAEDVRVLESFGAGLTPQRARAEADALAALLNDVAAVASSGLAQYA
jgi:hypothetical protein